MTLQNGRTIELTDYTVWVDASLLPNTSLEWPNTTGWQLFGYAMTVKPWKADTVWNGDNMPPSPDLTPPDQVNKWSDAFERGKIPNVMDISVYDMQKSP